MPKFRIVVQEKIVTEQEFELDASDVMVALDEARLIVKERNESTTKRNFHISKIETVQGK